MFRTFVGALAIVSFSLVACSQPAPPPAQTVTVQCPADTTCDVNVQPPAMSSAEIQYHMQQRDLTDDILMALMVQDMAWRNCWSCYDSYYDRYPSYRTYAYNYYNMPPQQRYSSIQQNNTTVIQKNVTVIQQVQSKEPQTVKAAPQPTLPPAAKATQAAAPKPTQTSAQNVAQTGVGSSGSGNGTGATNKAAATPVPAKVQPTTRKP